MDGSEARRLDRADATAMAAALAFHLGPLANVRLVLIKGIASDEHRLRAPRVSSDVDVIVSEGDKGPMLEVLAKAGWRERPSSHLYEEIVQHSSTLIHPNWPVDIDLHTSFPGLLVESDGLMDVLLRRSQETFVAGTPIRIPDFACSFLIMAAHSMRAVDAAGRHGLELEELITGVIPRLTEAERIEVRNCASELRAIDTLRPVLATLGADMPPQVGPGVDPSLDEWRERTSTHGNVVSLHLARIRTLRGAARVRYVTEAIWPAEAEFRLDHPDTPSGRLPAVIGRLRRLLRGASALPTVFRGRRTVRRGVTVNPFSSREDQSS